MQLRVALVVLAVAASSPLYACGSKSPPPAPTPKPVTSTTAASEPPPNDDPSPTEVCRRALKIVKRDDPSSIDADDDTAMENCKEKLRSEEKENPGHFHCVAICLMSANTSTQVNECVDTKCDGKIVPG